MRPTRIRDCFMPFTMEETNRYLRDWRQNCHWGEPNDPHTQEFVGLVHRNVMRQLDDMQCRVAFVGNEQDGIHQLVETIRNLSPRMYVNLTDDIMTEIVTGIREIFPDVAHCTIDHYGDENCKQRIIELFEYVRDTLYERLHLEGKKPTLSIVSRVINMVFGNIPIITITLRKQLYSLGYLVDKVTESIKKVLDALYHFWHTPTVQDIVRNIERILQPIIEQVIATTIAERVAGAIAREEIIDLRILILVAVIIEIGQILCRRFGHNA